MKRVVTDAICRTSHIKQCVMVITSVAEICDKQRALLRVKTALVWRGLYKDAFISFANTRDFDSNRIFSITSNNPTIIIHLLCDGRITKYPTKKIIESHYLPKIRDNTNWIVADRRMVTNILSNFRHFT